MKYVLASASPRRQELLTQAGFSFDVIPSAVKEKITKDIPSDVVMELAYQKALDVYESVPVIPQVAVELSLHWSHRTMLWPIFD